MSKQIFASSRTFRVWLYTVSHSTLLVRSTKGPDGPTRIDVIFKPVRYINVPTTLKGLDIWSVDVQELRVDLLDAIGPVTHEDTIFALAGPKGRSWIVSGVADWHEDDGDDFDASHFSVPKLVW